MNEGIFKDIKIVWVEDDKFLSGMIASRLGPTGAALVNVADGANAVDVIKQEKPDMVVLDLLMPNVDGFTILQRVKSEDSIKSIPVIVLSNLGQKEEIERCKKLGAEEFIVKASIGLDEIIPRIYASLLKSRQKKA